MDLKNDVEVITGLYPVYSILYNNSREVFFSLFENLLDLQFMRSN